MRVSCRPRPKTCAFSLAPTDRGQHGPYRSFSYESPDGGRGVQFRHRAERPVQRRSRPFGCPSHIDRVLSQHQGLGVAIGADVLAGLAVPEARATTGPGVGAIFRCCHPLSSPVSSLACLCSLRICSQGPQSHTRDSFPVSTNKAGNGTSDTDTSCHTRNYKWKPIRLHPRSNRMLQFI